jgi:penicillin amidase
VSALVVILMAVAGVLVAAVLVLHHVLFRAPLPRTRGVMTVDGLDGEVTIRRDRWGVPHISARSLGDAAFALGLAHAQDRGWQLDFQRRVASGRISEIAGADGLEADRLLRRLGFLRVAAAEEAALAGEERVLLEAYSAGVNAVMTTGVQGKPLELRLLRRRFEPWRPAHSLATLKVVSLGLATDMDFELQRLRLAQAVGPELAAQLEPAYPAANPTILPDTLVAGADTGVNGAAAPPGVPAETVDGLRASLAATARWLPSAGSPIASNNWVVAGVHTATGRPMLCNDPHLPPSVPSIWYEAHVHVEGDLQVAGVGFVGVPFVVIGHTDRVGWGFTNSFADVQDLVVEEMVDETRYRTESGLADAEVVAEPIDVRGEASVVERVLVTRHGPVVSTFAGADGAQRCLALQWGALQPGRPATGLLGLARARSADDLRIALWHLDAPQNCVWADVDGHVGYVCAGRIPVRPGPASRLPLAGWEADRRFVRWLTPEELPQLRDPEQGFIVTANNRVCGPGFPHHIGFDTMNGYRARRIERLLAHREAVDAARMAAVQLDVVCIPAREVAALLAAVACGDDEAEHARQALCGWDGVMAPDRAEPLVYETFAVELQREVLEPLCGEAWRLAAGEMAHPVFGTAGNITGRMLPELLRRWREGDEALLGGRTWTDVAAAALTAAVVRLRREAGPPSSWRWGRVHAVALDHALGLKAPLTWLLNLPALPIGGNTDTVLQTAWAPGRPFRTRGWAPSWRQILDVGNWDACTGVHLPGQSGHPASRHHRDLVEPWLLNQQHRLAWSDDAVDAVTEATLVLRPRPVAVAIPDAGAARQGRAA